MKIGIQTRPWGPEKNRQQLPSVLAEIASAGYDGVEIGVQHLDVTQPEAFRQLAASHGLQPAAIHTGGEIYDPHDCRELRYICDHTDPALVSLCLDVAWVHRAGGQPAEVAQTFLDRIAYFHIKDTTATEWREVGYGEVDLASLFAVTQRGTREWPWLVVEQDETQRPPVESARMSREYLKNTLGV